VFCCYILLLTTKIYLFVDFKENHAKSLGRVIR
jgi:hypothetical protein